MKNLLLFGIIILIFQSTILGKVFSIGSLTADFLVVYILLISLNTSFNISMKSSFFLGILQDLFSLNFMNSISKPFISFITNKLKNYFFVSSFWIKTALVIFISFLDIFVKNIVLFLFKGVFEISVEYLFYLFINFLIFYLVYLTNEDFKI
ncbi:MAG: rod shape-determining protein MreD [Hydrogenothermus sp.]|nr:MAG: rod shape-determining protein MreD [Hydrogenothermus sp.]